MKHQRAASALLRQLREHGAELWTESGKLLYSAPRGVINADVLDDLRRHKADLIELLNAPANSEQVSVVPRQTYMPLSFAQQRIWFLSELERGNPVYNVALAKRIRGSIDADVLARSFMALLQRHEALRSVCVSTNDGPQLRVTARDDLPAADQWFTETTLPTDTSDTELQQIINAEARRPLSLLQAPLLRAHLFRRSESDAVLAVTTHHFAVDGWSCGILLRELSKIYSALLDGNAEPLPEPPLQYADFAAWQSGWLSSSAQREQLDYWAGQLAGLSTLELATDNPRPRVQSTRGDIVHFALENELARSLRQLSRDIGTTLYMTLLAAFQVLLQRYSGQDEVVIGTAVSNRHASELETIVGPCANLLALRIDLSDDCSFINLVDRTQQMATRAFAHQDLPFETLVELLKPARDRSRSPLFQVLFVVHQYDDDEDLVIPAASVSDFPVARGTAMYDLFLQVIELNGQISASFEYNADLFRPATIERLQIHFVHLLREVAARPQQLISQLTLVTHAQQQQLLAQQQPIAKAGPQARVHELVEATAGRIPQSTALIAGTETLSYALLNARANRLARTLRAAGARAGQVVGIACERGIAQVISVLAVLKTGAAYLPLDPHYPAQRLRFMLKDSGAALLITDAETAEQTSAHSVSTVLTDTFDWHNGDDSNLGIAGGDSVYVIYTSGSTGVPKGVELTHAGLGNLIQWQNRQPRLAAPARTLQFASLSFDVSFQELFTTWAQGGTVVLVSETLRRDFAALGRFLVDAAIERLYVPCAALQPLAEALLQYRHELKLRDVITAGEQLQITPTLRRLFAELKDARLHNHYGPSETHVVTTFTLPEATQSWPALPPIGKPVSNTATYVLDKRLQPVPAGVPGELYIAGVQVALGYRGRSDLSAELFSDDPRGGGRRYRTGDRVRMLEDGTLEYMGRTDQQLKWRGFRIEPGEIEACLLRVSGVSQSTVVLRSDATAGPQLVAYVVAEAHTTLSTAQLRGGLQEELPEYMVPAAIMLLPTMPLTPSGKVDRSALPAPDYTAASATYVAPGTPTERTLVEIWRNVLGVERIGSSDDFFTVGGHSLLATRLISRIRDQFDVDLPLSTLFDEPTIAGLATALDTLVLARAQQPARTIMPANRSALLPLSYAQQRLHFLDELEPGNSLYNMPFALRIEGPLDRAALHAAVADVVERHETLRTVFPVGADSPHQEIRPTSSVTPQYETVAAAAEFDRRAAELAGVAFNLAEGPVFRLHVLSTSDEQHCLIFVIHHIACDLWSMDLLFRDLGHFYARHRGQQTTPLKSLPAQYVDYAVWQRQQLSGERLARLTDYWRSRLQDALPVLELPLDHLRPAEPGYRGAWLATRIPGALAADLEQLANERGCTLFMLTLAVFGTLLAKHSGEHDFVVGTPVAGRLHTDLEELIGLFLNTLALRIDTSADPAFGDFLTALRGDVVADFEHQEFPFEQLVELLHSTRDMSFAPVFQHMFICQDNRNLSLEMPGLSVKEAKLVSTGASKFDLTLSFTRDQRGAEIGIEYATELFRPASVKRLLRHYVALLQAVVSNPEQRLSCLQLLDAEERGWLMQHARGTQQVYPAARCLHRMVEAQVERTPQAIAVRCGSQRLSYTELNQRANYLAQLLVEQGAGPGERVAIACSRSLELAVAVLAVVKTGACYVPIDPGYPQPRISLMLKDSGARLVLTESADYPDSQQFTQLLLDELDTAGAAANLPDTAALDDPIYCIYTSGSTGQPKGVLQSHRALANLLAWQQQHHRLGQAALTLQFAALSFDVSVQEFFGTWTTGGCLCLVTDELRRDLTELAGFITTAGIERLYLPAAALPPLVYGLRRAPTPPALRDIIAAGEPLQVTAELRQLCSQISACALHNHYGPTETHVVTALTLDGPAQDWPALPSIGRPLANTECYVVDSAGQLAAPGMPGELYLGGAQVALGYWARHEEQSERFVTHRFGGTGRLYRTGDRVRWLDSGELQFLGRCDEQLKWRGFRIEPGEIETAMCAVQGVASAAIVAHSSGAAPEQLVGYYVMTRADSAADSAADAEARIRAALKSTLPDYMLPTVLVRLDEWPVTPSGKIDRRRLSPPAVGPGAAAGYRAPCTPAERTLTEVWAEVLGLEQAGLDDDFFALGGHSLLATQIIARIDEQLGVRLPLKYLFRYSTPLELAGALETLVAARRGQPSRDEAARDEFTL